ncbi:MAG: hypothetical protein AAGA83_00295 [Cyanobacteria bacterium P01_F01_bin.116]
MVVLSPTDRSRAQFHLNYSAYQHIPQQDVAEFEEAVNNVASEYIKQQITTQLNRCDEAFKQSNLVEEPATFKATYVGDINRTEARFDLTGAGRAWWGNYLQETDILAAILHVPNYWHQDAMRYRYERDGTSFVNAIPGPADTAIGATMYVLDLLAGGSG